MSERGRGPRAPPKLSKGRKTSTSASQESKVHASERVRAESSRGAAQAQQSTSQSAAASDQSVQTAQEALSALQLSTSTPSTIRGSGNAAIGPVESAASTAPGPRVGLERTTRQVGQGSSLGLRVPRLPSKESSRTPLADPTSKERQASQSGREPAPRSVGAAGPSSSRTVSGPLGRGDASLSSVRLGQPARAGPSTATRARTAECRDTEGSTSERSSTTDTLPTSESEAEEPPRPRGFYRYDNETRVKVFTYLSQQMSEPEIRSRTGVSKRTIQLWKKRWALEIEPFLSPRKRIRPSANRQGRRAYDEETRSRIFQHLADGMPLQQISDTTGVSLPTISNWRKEQLLPPSKPSMGLAWSQETRERVAWFLAQGMTAGEIKDKTGVPATTIYRWRREEEGGVK